jgi:FkbM family methyltransferase
VRRRRDAVDRPGAGTGRDRRLHQRHPAEDPELAADALTGGGGRRTLYRFEVRGVELLAYDEAGSLSAERVAGELLADAYGLESIPFRAADMVIDVGAHVGLVSVYLAKRWPFLLIHAFEPHPVNHRNCAESLRLNGVTNVRLERRAVTADGRPIVLRHLPCNTGGATAVFDLPGAGAAASVASTTLADIYDETLPPGHRCRLLKLDCEGMEYEILRQPRALERIDYLAAELHYGADDGPARALAAHCARFIPAERLRFVFCPKRD